MKKVVLNQKEYELVKENKDGFVFDEVESLFTEYFDEFDYVFGDYSYSKLRLKGFYESSNKKVSKINNIKDLDNYINKYCSYGCSYFLIRKIEK